MGHSLDRHIMFSILQIHCHQQEKSFIIDFSQNFIFFTGGPCEDVMNDHVLLNISTITGKWFRKLVFNFNLTDV